VKREIELGLRNKDGKVPECTPEELKAFKRERWEQIKANQPENNNPK